MRPSSSDPTAGKRGREISRHPGAPQSLDPTAGEQARELGHHPGAPQPITDPTDPRYGEEGV